MTRADMDRVRDDFVRATRAAPPRPASTGSSCTARTATCCRRSSRRSPTSAPTSTAARSRTACAIRSRCSARCARPGRRDLPMSVRISAHDWVDGRHHARRRGRDRARLQGRRRRPDRRARRARSARGRSRSTAACTRRRSPTASATRSASRRSRSARSPRPTTSTASSRPAAPTCAPSRARTSPTRPGRCIEAAKIGYTRRRRGRSSTCSAKTQLERNLERERAAAAQARPSPLSRRTRAGRCDEGLHAARHRRRPRHRRGRRASARRAPGRALTLLGRSATRCEPLADAAAGERTASSVADVRDADVGARRLRDAPAARSARCDILVNNAGQAESAPFAQDLTRRCGSACSPST